MPILTSADYPTIRVYTGTDSTTLPDATLAITVPLAEVWAEGLIPDWQTIITAAGADATLLKAAASYYAAYTVVDWLQQQYYESENLGDYSYQRNRSLDWPALRSEWLRRAYLYLNQMSERKALYMPSGHIVVNGPTTSGTGVI